MLLIRNMTLPCCGRTVSRTPLLVSLNISSECYFGQANIKPATYDARDVDIRLLLLWSLKNIVNIL